MKLEEIRKLIEATTPGPWRFDNGNDDVEGGGWNRWTVCDISRGERLGVNHADGEPNLNPTDFRDDGEFIAASRTLMPKLLAVAVAAKIRNPLGDDEYYKMADAVKALDDAIAALEADE
jgi:hypothetical protein